jgi:competence protein ComEC
MFLPVTAAFLSGLVVGSFLPYFPFVSFGVLLAAAAVMTWLEAITRLDYRQGLALYAALLSGTLYWTGCAWLTGPEDGLSTVGREPVTMIGTIVEPVRHSPERAVMVLSISKMKTATGEQTRTGRVRVTWRHPDQDIRQGDTVAIHARIRPPTGVTNPGGFDYGQYLRLHHIDAVASISGPGSLSVQRPSHQGGYWNLWQSIDGWRDRVRQAAVTSLDQPALGLYLGMIIGEPDYLSPDVRDRFMSTGTVHILSISGSHLGLIAFLAFLMAKWVCRSLPAFWLLRLSRLLTPTRCAVLLTVTPVVLYTLLAGAQIATVRSLVMILLFLTAVWLGRPNSVVVALACAAWLLLLPDPNALFDISFQLSFVSVLAIGLVVRRFDREETVHPPLLPWRERAALWVRDYVMLSGAVTLATLPLVAYHFNQIAWIGIVSNALVVPFAGFVLVPVGLASAMWLLLSGGDVLPAAAINQSLCDALMNIVDAFASIPGVEWHVASPSVFLVIAFYLMLCPLLQSRNVAWTKRACAVGIVLIIAWWAWSPRFWNGETVRVTFLDVGQGDACVIELPGDQTVLIDGGAAHDTLDMGRAVIGPFLWDQGIRRIDHVIGTHPQLDHIGGLPWVLRHFTVSHYWGNGMKREEAFYRRLDESLSEAHLSQELAVEGAVMVDSGGCRLRVLNPPLESGRVFMASEATRTGTVLNNQSVVTRLDCGSHSFLFTADIETETIGRLRRLHADAFRARIVKVPHHGARSSLDPAWIRETAPDVAVITVGRSNAYGHPAGPVLAAYAGQGIGLLRTDRDGAVQVLASVSGNDVTIRLARDAVLQPVKIGRGMADEEAGNIRRLWEAWRPL